MIIFGTRNRTKAIDAGQFYCPHCRAVRPYERKSARQYFALYFIPVFPIGQPVEFVECQVCGTAFSPDVLNSTPPPEKPDLVALLNNIGAILRNGRAVEYVIRDLTAAGLDLQVARETVEARLGTERNVCRSCGLTYAAGIEKCAVCGGPLQAAGKQTGSVGEGEG